MDAGRCNAQPRSTASGFLEIHLFPYLGYLSQVARRRHFKSIYGGIRQKIAATNLYQGTLTLRV